jgi:hypothetical protein
MRALQNRHAQEKIIGVKKYVSASAFFATEPIDLRLPMVHFIGERSGQKGSALPPR